jgi:hypothetical protein
MTTTIEMIRQYGAIRRPPGSGVEATRCASAPLDVSQRYGADPIG